MVGLIFLVTVFTGVVVLGFTALSYYHETQRIEQIRIAAERMGFSYRAEGDPGLQERLGPFHLFSKGHSRKIENVLRREIHDIEVTLFEYRYRTNSGKHTQTHRQTVLLFETGRLQLPLFSLRPQGILHRLAGMFGYQDINFESHPFFSEGYLLRGPEQAQIRSLFSEEALCYFTRHEGLCVEGDGRRLVFYQPRQVVEPGWLEGFLEQGLDVLDLFMKREGALGAVPFLGFDLGEAKSEAVQPVVVGPGPSGTVDEMLDQLGVEWMEQ
jgi:carbonic anhydrase